MPERKEGIAMRETLPILCPSCYQVVQIHPVLIEKDEERAVFYFACPSCDERWTEILYTDEDYNPP